MSKRIVTFLVLLGIGILNVAIQSNSNEHADRAPAVLQQDPDELLGEDVSVYLDHLKDFEDQNQR